MRGTHWCRPKRVPCDKCPRRHKQARSRFQASALPARLLPMPSCPMEAALPQPTATCRAGQFPRFRAQVVMAFHGGYFPVSSDASRHAGFGAPQEPPGYPRKTLEIGTLPRGMLPGYDGADKMDWSSWRARFLRGQPSQVPKTSADMPHDKDSRGPTCVGPARGARQKDT